MLAGVTKNAMALLLAAAAVLLLSPSSTDAATLSYPKCEDGASGCCTFGSGKMKDHGYAVVRMDVDTIITCSKGSLKCFAGNPNLRASVEGRDEITCPDFSALEESRSEIEYLDGEKVTTTKTTTTTSNEGLASVHAGGSA